MYKLTIVIVASLIGWSGVANAQYVDERPQGPLLGGPGDYVYPVLCLRCSVWQDYRNFAWNQLSINGGYARTPSNPNHVTTFRIFTHPSNDLYPATVEITLKSEDVEFMSTRVGYSVIDPKHFIVETHPENGDRVPVSLFPKQMGKLVFPYNPDRARSNETRGTRPVRRGGGTSRRGGLSSRGAYNRGAAYIDGYQKVRSENFCGRCTDYICIQF